MGFFSTFALGMVTGGALKWGWDVYQSQQAEEAAGEEIAKADAQETPATEAPAAEESLSVA